MQKNRVCSFITALCIAVMSIGAFPGMAMAVQTFDTEQVIEAERGALNGVVFEKDSKAFDKTSVYINSGAVSKSEDISLEAMSWLVNLPKAGKYRIFVRGYFSKDSRDDFWIGTNDDDWQKISAGADTAYKWVQAAEIEAAQGIKKIKIQPAETDGRFDAIYVTSNTDEDYTPPVPDIEEADDEEEKTAGLFVHRQEKVIEVTGTGVQFDADMGSYTSDFVPTLDRNAANLNILKASSTNSVSSVSGDENPHFQIEFKTDKTASYSIWVRLLATGSSSDSIFTSFGDGDYKNKSLPSSSYNTYRWYKVYTGKIQADTVQKFRLRSRETGCCVDNFIITNVNTFSPTGRYGNLPEKLDSKAEKLENDKYEKPPVYPPANEHPRVLFRASDIPRIIENMNSEQNAEAKAAYEEFLAQEIDKDSGEYSVNNFMSIEAHAFDYAINGNKENAIAAIEGIKGFLENNTLSGQEPDAITRSAGYAIYTAAEVYDWCYDVLTPAEKTQIVSSCSALASGMEIGWPPSGQGAQAGHGGEAQLLRDFMSLAIAAYDERPDLWNFIAGRYYQEYVPTFKFWRTTMYQGTSYGNYRQMWSTWSYLLLKGMGAEVPVDVDAMANDMLWQVYYRRPDGQMLRDGDIYDDRETIWSYWPVKQQASVNGMLLSGNKFLKLDAARTNRGIVYSSKSNEYASEILFLIFNDPELQPAKNYSELPLSKYFDSPHGIMVARTGWEDGVESSDVVARMKIGEYQTNNHQHLDAGEFQIYYKGALATDSGVYQGLKPNDRTNGGTTYGSEHMNQYATKTIAHNCMLVYDPSEGDAASTARGTINDGGQSAIENGGEFGLVSEDSEAHVGRVEGHEIDPTDTMEPNYTYLKGDLTNAYTNKVTDYKRSFMFLNLKDEKVPAAMIVFDKIDSSNETFKKTWLLHGLEEPTIDGNRTVFSRTYHSTVREYGYNGKLTVDTLLPADSSITKVGGEDGYSNVNGVDYTGYPSNSQTDEGSTWRIEVSPKAMSKEDCFLNVMQVSDNDKSEYLPVALVENDLFCGATISDRVVMFSKSGKRISEGFTIDVSAAGELQYTICDVASGAYKIESNGKTQVAAVSEDGGVLAFKAEAGKVTVEKTNEEPTPIQEQTENKTKNNDIVNVRINDVFIYNSVPAVLKNDTVLINENEIERRFGVETEKNGDSLKFARREGNIEFALGSNTAIVNSEQVELPTASECIDGVWMVPVRAAIEALGGKISWDKYSNTAFITLPEDDLSLPAGYAKIVDAEDDGGVVDELYPASQIIDEDAATIWSAQGVGRYVTLELERECIIQNAEIMFNPNSSRNAEFAIEISEDGKKFTNIYSGKGDGSVETGSWEKFEFDKPYSAKYVRYIGNGSNLSNWNAVKEIRFKLK